MLLPAALYMTNVRIEKPGEGVFLVKIGSNRSAAEKELKEFIAGRSFTRYVDHFNPNNQIIEIREGLPAPPQESSPG